jgi:nitrogen fixation/metabolism regulation signal transduction histidine kinase
MNFRFWKNWWSYGNRLSMRGRIGLGITLSRLIFLPVIFLAIYYLAGMVKATNQIATVDAKAARIAEQIISEIGELRRAEKNYLLLKDPSYLKKMNELSQLVIAQIEDGLLISSTERNRFARMKEAVRAYVTNIEIISQSTEPGQDVAALKQFSKMVRNYQSRIDSLLTVAKGSRSQEEISQSIDVISNEAMSFDRFIVQSVIASEPKRFKLFEGLQSKGDEIANLARLINENSWKKVEEERSHAEELGNRATLLITVTLVVTLLLSFAFTWYLPRKVLHPIRAITQALRKASNGNYDVFLHLSAKDELGELVYEFHNFIEHVRSRETSNPPLPPDGIPAVRAAAQQGSFTAF